MCNKLHEPYKAIPEEGIAWKLFSTGNTQLINFTRGYRFLKDNWIVWNKSIIYYPYGDGFCMFATEKEAAKVFKIWNSIRRFTIILNKVEYKEGLGICKEDKFVNEIVDVLIAKRFRII